METASEKLVLYEKAGLKLLASERFRTRQLLEGVGWKRSETASKQEYPQLSYEPGINLEAFGVETDYAGDLKFILRLPESEVGGYVIYKENWHQDLDRILREDK